MKNFRIWLTSGLILLFVSAGASAQTADGKKIGYLDLSKVFDEYEKTKTYDSMLEAKHKEFEAERNKKIDKLREAQGKLALLKEEEKKKVEEEIESIRAEILEFDRQKKTDLTKERDEKIREVLLEIEKTVSVYSKEQGYTLVLNDRVLIYVDKTMNITGAILKILNENYTKNNKDKK